jgi:integrase
MRTEPLVLPTTELVLVPREVVEPRAVSLPRAAATYLLFKRKRLTAASERGYCAVLDAFSAAHSDLLIADLEPPHGSTLIEDFLTARWGDRAPRTYNKSHSILSDFIKFHVARGTLHRDPMLTLDRAKPRQFHRTTFNAEQRDRIFAANPEPRDQIALHLLLDYGIRKGALQGVRFDDFNHEARRLVVFTKGGKIHELPIPDDHVWTLLDDLAEPGNHYLLPKQVQRRRIPPHRQQLRQAGDLVTALLNAVASVDDPACARELARVTEAATEAARWLSLGVAAASVQVRRTYAAPIGDHAAHDWWYRCLNRAGIVDKGVTRGQRMHKARHSAGQRVLDKTGNLKAAQTLLGHATIATTGDAYTGWETVQMAGTMRDVLGLDDHLLQRVAPKATA